MKESSELADVFTNSNQILKETIHHQERLKEKTIRPLTDDEKVFFYKAVVEGVIELRLATKHAQEHLRFHNTESCRWSNWINEAQKIEEKLDGLKDFYIPPTSKQ